MLPATGYSFVYHIEMFCCSPRWSRSARWCASRARSTATAHRSNKFGLAEFPG